MNIDLKKPIKLVIKTNDGWIATVVSAKGCQPWPLIGVVSNASQARPMQWAADGTAMDGRHWDICNVPEKIKVDVWLNIFVLPSGNTVVKAYDGPHQADYYDTHRSLDKTITRSACFHITTEVEEGFGITDKE